MIRDNKLYGLFLALFVFTMPGYSLTGRIQGFLPGKENTNLYISYFPPGPDNTKFSDSCIIDSEAKFEFITPFNEPVLAELHTDFMCSFYFMTDTGVVKIIAIYPGKNFIISQIQAVSPANKEYSAYKEFIRPEYSFTDSVNIIKSRLFAEMKSDSIKFLEPVCKLADSLLFTKTYEFVKNSRTHPSVRSMLVYRDLMLKMPIPGLKDIFSNLEAEGRYSIYGIAILEYIQAHGNIKVGDLAPSFFNQVTPDGKRIKVEDFRGKYLLIDFWAAWCSPCRKNNPTLVRLYQKFNFKGFEILGISLDRKRDEWLKAIDQDRLSWPQGSDIKYWDNECVQLYGINGIPFNVLINAEGRIIAVNLDMQLLEKKLTEIFPGI